MLFYGEYASVLTDREPWCMLDNYDDKWRMMVFGGELCHLVENNLKYFRIMVFIREW